MKTENHNIDPDNAELNLAWQLVQHTNRSLFITGRAGTGKSTFLRYMVKHLPKKTVVLAPTGVAAMNVQGMTIHSFFQFPLRPLLPEDRAIKKFHADSEKRKIIEQMEVLVIDEVSMVRADIVDAIDAALRRNTGSMQPFGGKQVIFFGDIFQLEPVVPRDRGEAEILTMLYPTPYFFEALVFKRMFKESRKLLSIEFQQVYRQRDLQFVELLERVRRGHASWDDLQELNARHQAQRSPLEDAEFGITLATRNDIADRINASKLAQLPGPAFGYQGTVEGDFDPRLFPTDLDLQLKQGAQVIFIRNDREGRWVNGTLGRVHSLAPDQITVETDNGQVHEVELCSWENNFYTYNRETSSIEAETVGSYTQFPLKLAWAVTIHKSQGLTFDRVHIVLGTGAFAAGQLYVALSRCRTLEGISLAQRIRQADMLVAQRIKDFSDRFNDLPHIKEILANMG